MIYEEGNVNFCVQLVTFWKIFFTTCMILLQASLNFFPSKMFLPGPQIVRAKLCEAQTYEFS